MNVVCDDITESVNIGKLYCYDYYDKCNWACRACRACRSCDKVHSCRGGRTTEALL